MNTTLHLCFEGNAPDLRSYPAQLGIKMHTLLTDLKPKYDPLPSSVSFECASSIFASAPTDDDWDDADVRSVINYLKTSRTLNIPDNWRPLLAEYI
jgi:hypothetical protein